MRLSLVPFLLVSFLFGCVAKGEEEKKPSVVPVIGPEVGFLAPDFLVKNLKGGAASLSQYRGKVVLINFWATWCEPCRMEMPSMEALYRSYPRSEFEILAVSIDTIGEPPVRVFIEDFGFSFPVLIDNFFEVNDRYQVRVVPTSILIDRKGVVAKRVLGAKDWNSKESRSLIDQVIQVKG
ncbi:MAG: TlpA disulfide reductase family protein [Candidatus Manganitrophaceae bacterium]